MTLTRAGNPLVELSTAAGLGSEALRYLGDDPGRTGEFARWLAGQSQPLASRWPAGDDMRKVLKCCALACAGLSAMLRDQG